MTTATRSPRLSGTSAILLRAAAGSLAAVLVVVALGGLVSGSPGALGALVGGLIVLAVFWGGTAVLAAMTTRSAELALMMALVTYSGQVIVVLGAFIGLSRSGLLDDTLSRGWLAIAVVVGSLVWSAAQLHLATRSRVPTYDLPEREPGREQQEAGA